MSAAALILTLLAAAMHAGWNLAIAGKRDVQAITTVALALGTAVLTPFAIGFWDVQARALPYIAASSALELTYFALLAAAYRRSPVETVYPVARGAAPVLVLVASVALLGTNLSVGQAAGIGLVAGGIWLVRGFGEHADARAVGSGLAVAATIAAYTLVDDHGLRYAAAVPYLVLTHVPVVIALLLMSSREALREAVGARTFGVGLALVGAYLLVLAALELEPAAPVAALRETSVVMLAIAAGAVHGPRVAGAAIVTAGIVLVAL